jgi:DNA-directed RNA polymerase specialized sigma24 family protein
MKIPSEFRKALERSYQNAGELNKLFVNHKPFIMRLVKHALRYNHWAVISDEDDLFQEACIWLVNSLWEWDEDKGSPLVEYVVYNIGVRLRNQIAKEQRQKRHPEVPPRSIHDQYRNPNSLGDSTRNISETIDGDVPDPESLLVIQRAYSRIERELPLLARELLESLILESGNLSAASRRVLDRGRVRRVEGMSADAFRQALRRNILSQLRTVLAEENIIPADDDRL